MAQTYFGVRIGKLWHESLWTLPLLLLLVPQLSRAALFELDDDDPSHNQLIVNAIASSLSSESEELKLNLLLLSSSGSRVCYEQLGCFSDQFFMTLPSSPETIDTFFSFTSASVQKNITWNATQTEIREQLTEMFQVRTRLVIIAHGFGASSAKRWNKKLTDVLLKRYTDEPTVVMLIDWRKGASWPLYNKAAANVQLVARLTVQWVTNLQSMFAGLIASEDIHFIGFSLGGQIAGYFAKEFFDDTNTKVGRVTALDTAAPLFEANGIYPSRMYTEYLEAVHTSAGNSVLRGQLGMTRPYGHVDYYPNGGQGQPGCSILQVTCDHTRAYKYYIEALQNSRCRMIGTLCPNVNAAEEALCDLPGSAPYLGNLERLVGYKTPKIVYFETNPEEPFCKM